MRLVLDTNVVVSALLWRGTPYRLLQILRRREDVKLFTSKILLEELESVLMRNSVAQRLTFYSATPKQLLDIYAQSVDCVFPAHTPRIVPNDPDDDHVIAAAIAANADAIATGDRHLLSLGMHMSIKILSPATVLANLATS